jgi:hypothetical protein
MTLSRIIRVYKEVLALPVHMSSSLRFSSIRFLIFGLLCSVLCNIVFFSDFFILVIVVSVVRFTASVYPFDILKPFLICLGQIDSVWSVIVGYTI